MNKLRLRSSARFSVKEQTLFAKRLSFLVKAGVPILESLQMLRRQTKSKSHGRIFDTVIADVSGGKFLSTSLGKFEHIFGNFAVNIIKVGETSGILSQNLNYLADELKKKQALRRKVIGALVYPIFITIATLGVTIMLTAYIFPKILPIFKSLHVALPLYTRILIFTSGAIRSYGLLMLGAMIVVGIALWLLIKKVKNAHVLVDRFVLKIPIVGAIALGYNMTNFCRTFGLLLKSGVPVVEALSITADTTPNLVYKKEFHSMARNVMRGEKISKHLEKYPRLFPDILTQMIAIGEATGNLSETLLYISELYENEVEDLTKNMSSSIEPVLMIFMGIIVGFVAISVITPIYAITQNLRP